MPTPTLERNWILVIDLKAFYNKLIGGLRTYPTWIIKLKDYVNESFFFTFPFGYDVVNT